MLETNKAEKICPFCGKKVINLAPHITNIHPKIMEKMEELSDFEPKTQQIEPKNSPSFQPARPGAVNLTQLIQEKLDIMLNIKIIEMLSKSPDTSLKEIAEAINPPPKTSLQELKEYHDLVFGDQDKDQPAGIETGNAWIDIAQQAIPIVKEMWQSKKPIQKAEVVKNVRGGESENTGILKPIQLEITGDTTKPGSTSEKPGAPSQTE